MVKTVALCAITVSLVSGFNPSTLLRAILSDAEGSRTARSMSMFKQVSALIVVLAMASPAAAQYAVRRNGDIVELEDTKNNTVVSINVPGGNHTDAMKVNGHDVLRPQGIPFLAPWANRLDEQAFWANGKRYAFDMDLGNVRGANPSQGFLGRSDQWQVVELKSDGKSAWLTSRLDVYKQPMAMKQWPFAHTIEMTHRLQDGVLQIQTTLHNLSSEPMPATVGFHPYYRLDDSPRDQWTVAVPAKTHWLLANTKVATGETESGEQFFPNGQGQLKDYNLDDVFSDLTRDADGRAHIFLKGAGKQQIELIHGPNFKALVVWSPNPLGTGKGSQALSTGAARGAQPPPAAANATQAPAGRGGRDGGAGGNDANFIAFEPQAGPTNALNLAQKGLYKDLQYVPAGGTWSESFWIKPSGF
jgi:aldose 1-epimerase